MAANNARSPLNQPGLTLSPVSRDITYFTARAVEELDRAETATDVDARLVHEQLANNYLRAALRLRRGEIVRDVADRVD